MTETEKKVSWVGGMVLLVYSFIYIVYGTVNKICSSVNDTTCLPAFFAGTIMMAGFVFLWWAFKD